MMLNFAKADRCRKPRKSSTQRLSSPHQLRCSSSSAAPLMPTVRYPACPSSRQNFWPRALVMNSTNGDIYRQAAAKSSRSFWLHTCASPNSIRVESELDSRRTRQRRVETGEHTQDSNVVSDSNRLAGERSLGSQLPVMGSSALLHLFDSAT